MGVRHTCTASYSTDLHIVCTCMQRRVAFAYQSRRYNIHIRLYHISGYITGYTLICLHVYAGPHSLINPGDVIYTSGYITFQAMSRDIDPSVCMCTQGRIRSSTQGSTCNYRWSAPSIRTAMCTKTACAMSATRCGGRGAVGACLACAADKRNAH